MAPFAFIIAGVFSVGIGVVQLISKNKKTGTPTADPATPSFKPKTKDLTGE